MPNENITFQTLPLTIELRAGDTRSGTSPDGKKWSVPMKKDYGFIRGTKGLDGEDWDVYVGDDETATHVYAIDQLKMPDCKVLDEQKFMLGFGSQKEAVAAYLSHYPTKKILGGVKAIHIHDFIAKVNDKTLAGKKVAMKNLSKSAYEKLTPREKLAFELGPREPTLEELQEKAAGLGARLMTAGKNFFKPGGGVAAATDVVKKKKFNPLSGKNIGKAGAVGALGVGIYGAKKGIDTAAKLVGGNHQPWQRASVNGPGRVF